MDPYRPPNAPVKDRTDPNLVKPRILPRDAIDILVILFVALPLQLFPMFGAPFILVYWASGSVDLAFLAVVAIYGVFMMFTVWSLRLDARGIEFRRLVGRPKFLRWDEITSIRPATRVEVVKDGWLWPLFPARETTACLSAKDHIRFEWDSGFCFFPPEDADDFLHLTATLSKVQSSGHV
jgi:hypothetical protein